MINEEKVVLMTKASLFERKYGKKALKTLGYFRWDYVSLQLLKGWVFVTVAFILGAALWVLSHLEYLLDSLNKIDLKGMGMSVALGYAAVVVIYLVIILGVFTYRYSKARREVSSYAHILKKISDVYAGEARSQRGGKTGGERR